MKKYLSILLVAVISISSICIGNKISASESEGSEVQDVEKHEEPLVDVISEETEEKENEELVEEAPEEPVQETEEDIEIENQESQETENFSVEELPQSNELEEQENLVQENEQSINEDGGLQTPAPTPEPLPTLDDIKQYFTWIDVDETAEVYTDDSLIEHMFYYYTGEIDHPDLVMNNSVPENIASAEIEYSFADGITGKEVDESETVNVGLWTIKAKITITDPITKEVLKVNTGKKREIINPETKEITYEDIIDVPTLTYIFEVRANIGNIIFDHELSFRYDGQPHVPTLTFYDDSNTVVENAEYTMTIYDHSETMIMNKGVLVEGQTLPTEKGEYRVHVDLAGETANHYKINMLTDFHYSIEGKAKITFAGFDIGEEDSKEIVANGHKFVWKKNDSGVYLEYNGYSPVFDLTEDLEYAIPNAKFVFEDGSEVKDIERGIHGDYKYVWNPVDLSIGYPVNIGFYRLSIDFSIASDYYDCCLDEAVFEIKPKPVSVKWTKTTIDAADHLIEKIPGYRIEGLVPTDVIGGIPVVDLLLSFKTAEGEDCLLPTKSGEYIATAKCVKYAGTVVPCCNYVLDGNYETSYVILDTKTIGKVVMNDKGGTLNIGTINKSSIEDVTMEVPSVDEAFALIKHLKNSGKKELVDLATRIEKELDNGGNVNLYISAKDVENPQYLVLPDKKSLDEVILLDVELYLCLDNDPTKYVINETGDFQVKVNFIIDEISANDIELASSRNCFVARYHNSLNPGKITQVYPIVRGDIGRRTYEFQFKSNKFSEFALYTQKKPTIDYTSHVVPNTKTK